MSKMIKRADGSYSKRGLWDNIRANKGSGKKPTKQMLEQERKIKKEENMKMEYKKGGKKSTAKQSFMEESKELKFGAPSKKFEDGGNMNGDPKKKSTSNSQPSEKQDPTTYLEESKKRVDAIVAEQKKKETAKGINTYQDYLDQKVKEKNSKPKLKMGGKKTMEPGGGGRFAKMVNKMKGEGKSEESAKAIAASVGRKKYGKSKFQEMAAAGKKKMGGKKC
jgi:hypothetical protein